MLVLERLAQSIRQALHTRLTKMNEIPLWHQRHLLNLPILPQRVQEPLLRERHPLLAKPRRGEVVLPEHLVQHGRRAEPVNVAAVDAVDHGRRHVVADGRPAADVLEPLPDGALVGGRGDGAPAEAAEDNAGEAPDGLEV